MIKNPAVVLDTNVFISGLLSSGGIPGQILKGFRQGHFRVITSKEQIKEIVDVLQRPSLKKALPPGTPKDVLRFFLKFKKKTFIYEPPQLS